MEFVEGDMLNVEAFAHALQGCDALFHTAAYFRDSYKGGKHWPKLYDTNVTGTERLLQAAYDAGIRRAVHTSSIAVLKGNRDQVIDETMSRSELEADDYYLSKILSEQKVQQFLTQHPDMFIAMVLPGWMFGPGDIGPTSSGRSCSTSSDKNCPVYCPEAFPLSMPGMWPSIKSRPSPAAGPESVTWAAGNHMDMKSIFQALSSVSGIKAPERKVPLFMLRIIALIYEGYYRITKKPVLISTSTVKLMEQEQGRTHFSHNKSSRELECKFRPVAETLTDTLDWYRNNNYTDA